MHLRWGEWNVDGKEQGKRRSMSCGAAFGQALGDSSWDSSSGFGFELRHRHSDNSVGGHASESGMDILALAAELKASRARLLRRLARVTRMLAGGETALL